MDIEILIILHRLREITGHISTSLSHTHILSLSLFLLLSLYVHVHVHGLIYAFNVNIIKKQIFSIMIMLTTQTAKQMRSSDKK